MNHEENRLNTFAAWPAAAAIEPIRVAKAGFFYTGQGVEVQCFSCGGKISEWNYGDQAMARHRRLDPRCPFIVDPSTSGNVPLLLGESSTRGAGDASSSQSSSNETVLMPSDDNSVVEATPTTDDELYRNDALRLLSFVNWPVRFISRESLASAGFYHKGGGRVRCAWCGGELCGGWRQGDRPIDEHRRHFPNCGYARIAAVLGPLDAADVTPQPETPPVGSPPIEESAPQTEAVEHNWRVLGSAPWRGLGVVGCGAEGPRHASRSTLTSRQDTYLGWPAQLRQTPDLLAEAGFFYTGSDDQVICFYCGGGLGKWEPSDVPWCEHARWFPHCAYVMLMKGRDFIERAKRGEPLQANTTENLPRNTSAANRVQFPVTEAQVVSEMEGPAALAALSTGLEAARVRTAIRRKLRNTGVGFLTSESLIDATLNEQLNEGGWSARPPLTRDILAETLRTFRTACRSSNLPLHKQYKRSHLVEETQRLRDVGNASVGNEGSGINETKKDINLSNVTGDKENIVPDNLPYLDKTVQLFERKLITKLKKCLSLNDDSFKKKRREEKQITKIDSKNTFRNWKQPSTITETAVWESGIESRPDKPAKRTYKTRQMEKHNSKVHYENIPGIWKQTPTSNQSATSWEVGIEKGSYESVSGSYNKQQQIPKQMPKVNTRNASKNCKQPSTSTETAMWTAGRENVPNEAKSGSYKRRRMETQMPRVHPENIQGIWNQPPTSTQASTSAKVGIENRYYEAASVSYKRGWQGEKLMSKVDPRNAYREWKPPSTITETADWDVGIDNGLDEDNGVSYKRRRLEKQISRVHSGNIRGIWKQPSTSTEAAIGLELGIENGSYHADDVHYKTPWQVVKQMPNVDPRNAYRKWKQPSTITETAMMERRIENKPNKAQSGSYKRRHADEQIPQVLPGNVPQIWKQSSSTETAIWGVGIENRTNEFNDGSYSWRWQKEEQTLKVGPRNDTVRWKPPSTSAETAIWGVGVENRHNKAGGGNYKRWRVGKQIPKVHPGIWKQPSTSAETYMWEGGKENSPNDADGGSYKRRRVEKQSTKVHPKITSGKSTTSYDAAMCLKVGIANVTPMTKIQMSMIQDAIVKKLSELNKTGFEPNILSFVNNDGWMLLKCADKLTEGLIFEIASGLSLWNGAQLTVFNQDNLPRRKVAKVWIPSEPKLPPRDVLRVLESQNPHITTKYWQVFTPKCEDIGQTLNLAIDGTSCLAIEKVNFRLSYDSVKVYVRIKGKSKMSKEEAAVYLPPERKVVSTNKGPSYYPLLNKPLNSIPSSEKDHMTALIKLK